MERDLTERPPADHFLALYFMRQGWWAPPSERTPFEGTGDAETDEAAEWVSPYPDVTE
ncbi:MAG TPA: hypothetical protein VGH15_05890 [Caulobacteraceae bacterium]|jgi:hypothetical protein